MLNDPHFGLVYLSVCALGGGLVFYLFHELDNYICEAIKK